MTSAEIRQSFLDFFKSKGHTIVPSASLLPDSPNLLFTNAGMNQFVTIFLGQRAPDVSKWPGAIAGSDKRAADTQKCIRAGGKHNDLEDVGLDTYHLTFFEMLGNWSFGDYFKRESLIWGWELLTRVWGIPPKRLFATVYAPDKAKGDPAEFDQEAADVWTGIFHKEGLDPAIHIVHGGKKDNFWMMGDTGPCGPCSEIHFNLLPSDDEPAARVLVNAGAERCIEIWNHVFIQFNANPDGTYSPLSANHVDTGMGFDRIAGFYAGTKGFREFSDLPSAYDTDIFTVIFAELEKLSGKKYRGTLPKPGSTGDTDQQKIDIAFRVIADHIRALSFAIADGIQPGNTDRNYVLRRILRRAVRFGRTLGFHEPFFYKLVSVVADTMGHVFPEIRARQDHIEQIIQREEEAFNQTLDRGIELFTQECERLRMDELTRSQMLDVVQQVNQDSKAKVGGEGGATLSPTNTNTKVISGAFAFKLYDTYGFPLDLTELMARERDLSVDVAGFDRLMEEQKSRARAAQKKTVVALQEGVDLVSATTFVGYESIKLSSRVLTAIPQGKRWAVVLPESPFYAEMGGQVGDTGTISAGANLWPVVDTKKVHLTSLHIIEGDEPPAIGTPVEAKVDVARRRAIERHHTVTHLLHWALHEVVSKDAAQKGSYVGPEKLTFDFSSPPLTPEQVADVEKLVNERILENARVSWVEANYADVKSRKDIMQLFGEKYGHTVRVVQIGGQKDQLDGYSMELCGGTHTRATGEIGWFRIVAESAIAAGIRRIEAVSGLEAYKRANEELRLIKTLSGKVNSPVGELENKIESMLAQQKELEKQLKTMQQKQAGEAACRLAGKAQTVGSTRAIVENLGAADGDALQAVADALKGHFQGVVVLGGVANGTVSLVATVSPELTKKFQAGKIIQEIASLVGGKGGGRPDNARGGGKEAAKLEEALAKARKLIS